MYKKVLCRIAEDLMNRTPDRFAYNALEAAA